MTSRQERDRPVIFLFGSAGDLSHRLILPALYALHRDGQWLSSFALIGADRASLSSQEFALAYRDFLAELRELSANV